MAKRQKATAKGTAASMVLETMKKRKAVDEKSAMPLAGFKNLALTTTTLSYTISNLIEEGVVKQTEDGKLYYDDAAFKALEKKYVKGYMAIFIVPILAAVLIFALQLLMK
ncbi:MAG: hypothetical protein HUJ53_10030 [Holdemanella sp.]|nr:hypothetical protein [Holdemanella sp.]